MDKWKEVKLFLRFLKELGWFRKYKYLYYHPIFGSRHRERRYDEGVRFNNLSKVGILDFLRETNPYFFVHDAFAYAQGGIWDEISLLWINVLKNGGTY